MEQNLKVKANAWFAMIKDVITDIDSFKNVFLKHLVSEQYQWEVFLKYTEAGENTVRSGFQEHFHYWMAELKQLDSPKISEEQAINLI